MPRLQIPPDPKDLQKMTFRAIRREVEQNPEAKENTKKVHNECLKATLDRKFHYTFSKNDYPQANLIADYFRSYGFKVTSYFSTHSTRKWYYTIQWDCR